MKYTVFLTILFCTFFSSCIQKKNDFKTKILLIPLDDRPPCLQFTERIGDIGNAEIISPPLEMIGRFTRPGQPDEISKWLKKLDVKSFDAAIISLDMVAYGGLVASRVYQIDSNKAMERLKMVEDIKKRAPDIKIVAQSVIMRIAPTGDGENDAYRSALAEWGVVSVGTDEASQEKTKQLEKKIPSDVLKNYKEARRRDLSLNLKSVELLNEGIIDYLILSQDDARPQGVHIADRKKIDATIKKLGLQNKVSVQAGTDEVSMLLLSRVLSDIYNYHPLVKVIYSSEEMSREVMPYEDEPLYKTVHGQIESAGAREVSDSSKANIFFYVFTTRSEKGSASRFTDEIVKKIKEGKQVMIADIDPIGDVQGGDSTFAVNLEQSGVLPQINSYASWNTAGNTIGTSISQGIVYSLAKEKLMGKSNISDKILTSQNWFTFHRMLDDFYYHTIVRSHIKELLREGQLVNDGEENMEEITKLCRKLMSAHFDKLKEDYWGKNRSDFVKRISCEGPDNMHFSFPWGRIFEADITFDLKCNSINNPKEETRKGGK